MVDFHYNALPSKRFTKTFVHNLCTSPTICGAYRTLLQVPKSEHLVL